MLKWIKCSKNLIDKMWILLLNRQPRSCVCFFHFTIITLIPNVVVVVIVASAECVCKVKWQNTYFCSKDEQDETMWKSRVRKKWFTQENCYKKTLFEPENNTSRPKRQEEFEKKNDGYFINPLNNFKFHV